MLSPTGLSASGGKSRGSTWFRRFASGTAGLSGTKSRLSAGGVIAPQKRNLVLLFIGYWYSITVLRLKNTEIEFAI